MEPNKFLHIDSALNQLLAKHPHAEGSDYSDFLKKLAEHDKTKVALDAVLEEKLSTPPQEPMGTWKNIVAIIWYRRIKRVAILLTILTSAFIALRYTKSESNKNTSYSPTYPLQNKPSTVEIIPQHLGDLNNLILENASLKTAPIHTITTAEKSKIKSIDSHVSSPITPITAIQNSETTAPDESIINIKLPLNNLKKQSSTSVKSYELISFLPQPKLTQLNPHKKSFFERLPKTGFVLGVQFNNSFQNWQSDVNTQARTTNRNYSNLANNGKESSYTMNYGLTFEKTLIKGFGISLGITKLTLKQQQNTDFILTEAPVYDIDGEIAGYIKIAPEKIQTRITNKIDYMAFPIQLMYGLKLTPRNSLQIKVGSSLTTELKKHTEKFNYASLLQAQYNSGGQRLSMNNLEYGVSIGRQIYGPIGLSLGYERQVFKKVNALSDRTETMGVSIHHFNISLKYKL